MWFRRQKIQQFNKKYQQQGHLLMSKQQLEKGCDNMLTPLKNWVDDENLSKNKESVKGLFANRKLVMDEYYILEKKREHTMNP